MKKIFTLALALMPLLGMNAQENEVTTTQAKAMYKDVSKTRVSVHDPSVVYEPTSKNYYIFGSHRGVAYTKDMQNWTGASHTWKAGSNTDASNSAAFVTPAVKKVMKGGVEVDLPQFNAMDWAARTDESYNINGNMWAPDVIYNKVMNKWCMYLSVNGDSWHSSIILLTADNITGPYEYQAPIVISGFDSGSHSYKDTDLELVIGTQSSLPSRYNVGSKWGNRYPNNIDPAVFYDNEGKLWMVYGSWSGGIWMLELDENTGLRDYDVTYTLTGSGDGITVDPYFGKKIAGGYYVSGEGPYIEHIGQYYYLFVSYGGFAPDGGYEMRVFRSENPDGPYKDASGRSAIFTSWVKNYGAGTDTRGEKIMGAYGKWGFMTTGECAQGHNSIIAANDGRTYLIYHTKFNDGNPQAGFHSVRTHQVFLNKNGWLVAAPFEYNGETTTDNDIATKQLVTTEDIPGIYEILVHKYKMNYENMEEVTPVKVTFTADGRITGAYTGTWKLDEGTSYLTIRLGSTDYNGVLIEEQIDTKSIKAAAFTVMANSGVNIWGYKYLPKYAVAWQVNNQKEPVRGGQTISSSVDLYAQDDFTTNIVRKWTSSEPEIFSEYGRFNPEAFTENNTLFHLTYRVSSGNYFWQKEYANLKAKKPSTAGDWETGMLAYYSFDNSNYANILKSEEKAQLKRASTSSTLPTVKEDNLQLRNENVVETAAANKNMESYVEIPNPLYGKDITSTGATLSFWVQRLNTDDLYGTLCGFYNPDTQATLYLTGNLYTGYNNNAGTWIDINHPTKITRTELGNNRWHHVIILFGQYDTTGIRIYVDGQSTQTNDVANGQQDGADITRRQDFKYEDVKKHISQCSTICLGKGSFWGSANARFDDVVVYERELKYSDIAAFYNNVTNLAFDFNKYVTGITETTAGNDINCTNNAVYDLSGRCMGTKADCMSSLKSGVYVCNGRKFIIK
ncbi:MAG: family 43 glycosylhydrolase [Prevotella sp.]|nr:family 43 glycosylhydrolase [Prevotella sp.]